MKYDVKNDEGIVLATFTNAVAAWAYDVAIDFMGRTHEEALLCSDLAEEIWLKDSNDTPVGHLCDYVAKNFKSLHDMTSRYDRLEDFYANYESEDYEIPDLVTCNVCGYKQYDDDTVKAVWELGNEDSYLCGACMDTSGETLNDHCPYGGDETDCSSCAYNADYKWSEEEQDCVRREDEENEDN